MIFSRSKQLPQQWGPANAVQSNLFAKLAAKGINPYSALIAAPCWERAGKIIYNYTGKGNLELKGNGVFTHEGAYLNGTSGTYVSGGVNPNFHIIDDVTAVTRIKKLADVITYFVCCGGASNAPEQNIFYRMIVNPTSTIEEMEYFHEYNSGTNVQKLININNELYVDTWGWGSLVRSGYSVRGGITGIYNEASFSTRPNYGSSAEFLWGRDAYDLDNYANAVFNNYFLFSEALSDEQVEYLATSYEMWQRPQFRAYFDLGASVVLSTQTSCSWKLFGQNPINTSWKLFDFNNQSIVWKIKNELLTGSKWKIVKSGASDMSWKLFADITESSAWKIITSKDQQASWKILKLMEFGASWAIINRMSQAAVWKILNENILEQNISWNILSLVSKPSAWNLLAKKNQSVAYKIFGSKDILIDWRILIIGDIHQNLAWGIKNAGDKIMGWNIQAAESASAAWNILNDNSQGLSWNVLQVTDAAMAFKIFTELEQDSAWVVGESGSDIPDSVYEFFQSKRTFIFSQSKRTFIFYQQER